MVPWLTREAWACHNNFLKDANLSFNGTTLVAKSPGGQMSCNVHSLGEVAEIMMEVCSTLSVLFQPRSQSVLLLPRQELIISDFLNRFSQNFHILS